MKRDLRSSGILRPQTADSRVIFNAIRILLFLIAGTPILSAQQADSSILAWVNGKEIRDREFIERFSLTIYPLKSRAGNEASAKQQFLLSMIAEKLLAEEARHRNVEQDPNLRKSLASAEAMFVRDKLYRDAVRAKVMVTEQELWKYYQKMKREMEFQFLFGKREGEMANLHRLLDAGMSFDSLLTEQQAKDSALSAPVRRTDTELLAAVKSLAPGQVSDLISLTSGYYIVRRMPAPDASQERQAFEERKPEILRRYREEREIAAAKKFVRDLWKGKKSLIRKERFAEIGIAMKNHLGTLARMQEGELLRPSPAFFDELRRRYEARGGEKFFSVGKDSVSLLDFIDRMEERSIVLRRAEISSFPAAFKSIVQDMIDEYLITREGYRRGLQNSPEVRDALEPWLESGLAQSLAGDLAEQFMASDDSLWQYYLRNPRIFGPPLELKILEILHSDPDTLEILRNRLARGASFRILARDRSMREGARDREGELGYFPITKYPEIGRAALGMKIGELSPIVGHKDGYSLFSLLDVRKKTDSTVASIADIRSQIERRWKDGVLQSRITKLVYDLTVKSEIRLNEALLASLRVLPGQMFTLRYLGFGGKIPAAASVMPLAGPVWEGLNKAGKIPF